jgi:regulation of enolase protein 1 (concanavalin A-like superfamily)
MARACCVQIDTLEQRSMMSAAPLPLPISSTKLTGTLIGTSGSYQNKGNTIANAVDGNTSSYFDAPSGVQGWVGFDLGTPATVTQVQFVPRSGFSSRMVGGIFQASSTIDFSSNVVNLYTVTSSPAGGVYTAKAVTAPSAFEFVRYLAPVNGSGNVAEVEFDGIAGTIIPPTPPAPPVVPAPPGSVTATAASASDVHLTWAEDPTSTVTSFTIERQGPTDATFVAIGTALATATSFDDTTVLASTAYSYELIANNAGGPSAPSDVAAATTPAVPVAPVVPVPPVVPVTPVTPVTPAWSDLDIGAVGLTGSATVNANGSITVTGSGADIWNSADAFNFDSQTFAGNGSIVAQVSGQTNTNGWAKSGIMIRETINSDSRFVMIALTPSNGVTFQARTATHTTPSVSIASPGKTGVWLEITRNNSTFSGYTSTNGTTWTLVGSVNIPMFNNVQAGLAVSAHTTTKLSSATFSNVSLTPAGTAASPWSAGAAATQARWESESFSYNNQLYVFGGYFDRTLDATTECDAYNPATNTWSYVTTMPASITHAAVTVVGDTVYIAGGNIGSFTGGRSSVATAQVLTYDITTGVWGSVAPLPAQVTSQGMVCINNTLISFGGINATNTVDQGGTYSLDLTNPSATWVTDASMPNPRNHLGYVAINGIAYAVGGMHLYSQTGGNQSEVDAYNPVTNTWTQVASLPVLLGGVHGTTLVVNNKIVVLGGQTNGGYDGIYQANVYEYDPISNAWTTVGTLPEANQGQSVAYINNQLIVADGTVDNQGGWAQNQVLIDGAIQL